MRILDNFISDSKILKRIEEWPAWNEKPLNWKGNAWRQRYESIDETKTIGGTIVSLIMQKCKDLSFDSVAGFEYWTTVLTKNLRIPGEDGIYSLPMHSDYDVVKYSKTKELSYPLFGAVLYFGNKDVEGGLLKTEDKTIEPLHNRLVIFNSANLHGVTEITKGERRSLAINFWKEPIML